METETGAAGSGASATASEAGLAEALGRWWRHWNLRLGVFAMAMALLGFLAYSALLVSPVGAWFIYLFLMPFLVWLPGWTLHPIAGWLLCGAWAVLFPWLRRRLRDSPSGRRWRRRQLRRWVAFGAGEVSFGGQAWSGSSIGRSSAGGSRGGGSATLTGGGGRFGGGGASSRW
jgi:uncharacterized protein